MNKYLIKTIGGFINLTSYFFPSYAAQMAVFLFSKPKKGKIKEEEIPFLNTSKKETVLHKNIPIATYHWSGNKETVLLVHGWESNTFRWKDLIELLKTKKHNIIALDAPAHGDSGYKTFNAILYSECINLVIEKYNPSIVVGHSIGGTSSTLAINNNKLDVKKLVLLGSPSNFNEIINNYIQIMGYSKRVIKAMNNYFIRYFGCLPDFYTIENFSKNLQAQGLIIHDKKDRIISYKDALQISKNYKNSILIKTSGFGHGLKNELVYNHILEFIND